MNEYGGKVPGTMEELLKLPGVGRKTANLMLGDVFHVPGVVVADTHCIRIAGRLGLTENTAPEKVENDLRAILPPEESNDFCHRLVLHGRAVCTARSPKWPAAVTLAPTAPLSTARADAPILKFLLTFYTALFIIPLLVQNFRSVKGGYLWDHI